MGRALRTDDEPAEHLHARSEDPGLGGHGNAHRRAPHRRHRHAVVRVDAVGGVRGLARDRQPRDPRPAVHV